MITGFDTGGAERVLLNTVRRLDPERFESFVVSLCPPGPLSKEVESAGVETVYLNMRRVPGPVTLWRLARIFRRKNVDVVHAYLFSASIASRLSGRWAGVPVVLTSTRAPLTYLPSAAWWLDRITARWCERIIAVSQDTANAVVEVEGIPSDKVVVIPNGVDLERFAPRDTKIARAQLGIDETAFVVASIGRLSPEKGQDYLLDALAATRGTITGIVCILAGGGPMRENLEARVRLLDLEGICCFLGNVTRIESVFAAADVIVLPSLFEGMPNVVLEAMAMGRPVIATAVGGAAELVRHNETGFLVPPADATALAAALVDIAASADRRSRMGRQSREVAVARHGIEHMIRSVERLYRDEWERASKRRGASSDA